MKFGFFVSMRILHIMVGLLLLTVLWVIVELMLLDMVLAKVEKLFSFSSF